MKVSFQIKIRARAPLLILSLLPIFSVEPPHKAFLVITPSQARFWGCAVHRLREPGQVKMNLRWGVLPLPERFFLHIASQQVPQMAGPTFCGGGSGRACSWSNHNGRYVRPASLRMRRAWDIRYEQIDSFISS